MTPTWPGGPPPGWYPDPAGEKAWRWWDGVQWTEHASDPSPSASAASPPEVALPLPAVVPAYPSAPDAPMAPVHPAAPTYPTAPNYGAYGSGGAYDYAALLAFQRFAAEEKAAPWARRAFFGFVLIGVATVLGAWADSAGIRHIFHTIQVANQEGVTPPRATLPARDNLIGPVELLLEVPTYVLLLMWQFKAAYTARMLRLPARRSPGLGVGGWFIPIVNLWFPYQAIRDCLPVGHSGRRVVQGMWACFIIASAVQLATLILAFIGNRFGFATAIVAVILWVGFAVQGSRAVRLIAESHRGFLYPGGTGLQQ